MKLPSENLPSWTKEWDFLIDAFDIADNYGIDKKILLALIQTESEGLTNCIRYEPFYKYQYAPEQITKLYNGHRYITYETIFEMQNFSYGIMQCMGNLFFEYGFHVKTDYEFLPVDMINPELSLQVGCMHLRKKIDQFKLKAPSDIYAAYNAGSVRLLNGKYKNQEKVDRFMKFHKQIEL